MEVKIKGVKEDGTFDVERKSTAMLVTELIAEFPKLCESDIAHRLENIRTSAERDDRIRKVFAESCKKQSEELKTLKEEPVTYVNDHEEELIRDGVESIKRCVENKDFKTMFAIFKFCKAIAGDKFSVEVITTGDDK